jgi:phosphoribosylanthranilate isomerase
MKVKICGIQDEKIALQALEYGADYLGFIFAKSKRQVSIETVRKIVEKLPSETVTVGVFVNEKVEIVNEIINKCNLKMVQFHGEETVEYCSSFSIPVIKAFQIHSNEDIKRAIEFNVDYLLFDSPAGPMYRGGNGITFDWGLIENLGNKDNVILAGGLNSKNIENAIKIARPQIVDISSGVETNGVKDPSKIKTFIKKAKGMKE